MSGYIDGRRVEYAAQDVLRDLGWRMTRGASSKGVADLLALGTGRLLLVSVKRTSPPGPAERAQLLEDARLLPGIAVPLVVLGHGRASLQWRILLAGGPRDWLPWHPYPAHQPEAPW